MDEPKDNGIVNNYRTYLRTIAAKSSAPVRFGDSNSYGALIRLQHLRAIEAMFAPLCDWISHAELVRLFDAFRKECPPKDSHPARWARPFATWVSAKNRVQPCVFELADYLAMRVEEGQTAGVGASNGQLRSYRFDPRTKKGAANKEKPVLLLVQRDARGRIFDFVMNAETIAAFGVESGAISRQDSLLRISEESLQRGIAELDRMRQTVEFVRDNTSFSNFRH